MLNFLAKFCPNLSDVVKALRKFTYKDVPFQWTDSHGKAFVESKKLIAQGPVLCHFSPQLPIILQVDVSSVGVGEGFLQSDQPAVFDSKSYRQLSSAPQTPKRKVLLNIWTFRIGTVCFMEIQISAQKDQSPLERIFKKPLILKVSNMAICSTHARKLFSCVLHLRFIKQTSNLRFIKHTS